MKQKIFFILNGVLSVSALSFLFWLIYFHKATPGSDLPFLPAVNATLNGLSAIFLSIGFVAIKQQKKDFHRFCMIAAFITSTVFLVCYIIYHSVHGDSHFMGQGLIRPIYFSILISHIILSVVVLPLILTTFYFAFNGNFPAHRKWSKVTLPTWWYVSVTGVLIFAILKYFP